MGLSRADRAVIAEAERIIRVLTSRIRPNKTALQVLTEDQYLCGQLVSMLNLILELPHLKLDENLITEELLAAMRQQHG